MTWRPDLDPLTKLQRSIHLAVNLYTRGNPGNLCHLVAITGHYALSQLTGDGWGFCAGSLYVTTDYAPADGGNPFRLEMNAHQTEDPRHEFHAWNVWVPPEMRSPREDPINADHPSVYLDFNAIFYRAWAEATNIPWTRPDFGPGPLVGHVVDLSENQGVLLHAMVGLSRQVYAADKDTAEHCCYAWHRLASELDLTTEMFKGEVKAALAPFMPKEAGYPIQTEKHRG